MKRTKKQIQAYVDIVKSNPEICGIWFEGCHVHHKDGNWLNNEPTNLIVLSASEHMKYHHTHRSKETCDKISKAHKGKKLSEEHKRKISESSIGRVISEEQKAMISAVHKGKTVSESTRLKQSLSHMGQSRPMSPETRQKIKESWILRKAKKNITP